MYVMLKSLLLSLLNMVIIIVPNWSVFGIREG